MLSPWTGLGLEAKKTGLSLDGNGLGLGFETLRPRPRVVRPRGLINCNVLISCSVANNCQFQLNIGNCYCKVSYHENRRASVLAEWSDYDAKPRENVGQNARRAGVLKV